MDTFADLVNLLTWSIFLFQAKNAVEISKNINPFLQNISDQVIVNLSKYFLLDTNYFLIRFLYYVHCSIYLLNSPWSSIPMKSTIMIEEHNAY